MGWGGRNHSLAAPFSREMDQVWLLWSPKSHAQVAQSRFIKPLPLPYDRQVILAAYASSLLGQARHSRKLLVL